MLNQKYYPFERNRYYYGKLLTAKDFESEQTYFNDKRRLVNRTVFGTGVCCGLNVYAADDVSLIVETGVALDEKGREIVVDEAVIKKITTIDGFDSVVKDEAYLGVEYAEEKIDKVYAPMSQNDSEESREYNKVKEKYRLFLAEEANIEKPIGVLNDFIEETIIYQNEEVIIKQYTPKFASDNANLKVKVTLEKTGTGQKSYSFTYRLDLQGFKTSSEEDFLTVSFSKCSLKAFEKIAKEYTLVPKMQLEGSLQFRISPDSFCFFRDEVKIGTLVKGIEMNVQTRSGELWDWLEKEYYAHSLDAVNMQLEGQKIWLAKVKFIRTNNACLIDSVQAMPFNQYLYNPSQAAARERLATYYPEIGQQKDNTLSAPSLVKKSSDTVQGVNIYDHLATGIAEIPIGLSASTRETIYSDEIMHGLGKGSVYIDLGIEYIRDGQDEKENTSEIVLGEAALFDEHREPMVKIKHGVKVFKDKGTFVIAIKLEEASKQTSIHIRWFAFKMPETDLQVSQKSLEGKVLMVSPDTIVVAPRESTVFSPVFMNMESEPCSFNVVEQDGGMITNMGVYTAPSREGVYTIQVQTLSKSNMKANAFVVVKQQKEEHK